MIYFQISLLILLISSMILGSFICIIKHNDIELAPSPFVVIFSFVFVANVLAICKFWYPINWQQIVVAVILLYNFLKLVKTTTVRYDGAKSVMNVALFLVILWTSNTLSIIGFNYTGN